MRSKSREQNREGGAERIDRSGDESCGRNVIYPQQVESGQQAAEYSAGQIARV
jgi:hypothetical protein